jgi:uncharacterized protein YggU (UPF0235/DUF167 family)
MEQSAMALRERWRMSKANVKFGVGEQNRKKTIAIQVSPNITPTEEIERIRALLSNSVVQWSLTTYV